MRASDRRSPKSLRSTAKRVFNRTGRLSVLILSVVTQLSALPARADMTPEQHYERGMQENLDSKFAEAIADYDAAIKAKPDYWKAYANRASAEYYAKEYRAALNDLNIATPHLPALQSLTDLRNNIENAMKGGSSSSVRTSVNRTQTINRINYTGGVPVTAAEQMAQLASVVMAGGHKIPRNLIHPQANSLIHPMGSEPATTASSATSSTAPSTTTSTTTTSTTTKESSSTNVTGEKIPASSELSAKDLLARGIQRANAQEWSGAISDLNECLMLEPKNGLAWAYRGSARLGSGDLQGAVVDLDRAVELMPNEPKIADLRDKMKAALEQARQDLHPTNHK